MFRIRNAIVLIFLIYSNLLDFHHVKSFKFTDFFVTFRKKLRDNSMMSSTHKPLSSSNTLKSLVLVGGGHGHIQLVKSLPIISISKRNRLRVTLVDVNQFAIYSGMIPGLVSSQYKTNETCIGLKSLSSWAGVEFINDEVTDIKSNHIVLKNGSKRIAFDCLSLDLGSTVSGLEEIEGVKEFTWPTRPINKFVERIEQAEKRNIAKNTSVVIVGGGAAGIELAFCMKARWSKLCPNLSISIVNSGSSELLASESLSCRISLQKLLKKYNITVLHSPYRVSRVTKSYLHFDSGTSKEPPLHYTYCIWATGAAAHTKLRSTLQEKKVLDYTSRGIKTYSSFQSTTSPQIFAVGDCATIITHPNLPKCGVHAVRSGPILFENILNYLFSDNQSLKKYTPQSDFLKLINCGNGTAFGICFGIPFQGTWVWKMKDFIDKSFVQLFQEQFLPDIKEFQKMNEIEQYDKRKNMFEKVDPKKAAKVLSSEDDLDFQLPLNILRDMKEDSVYAMNVIHHINLSQKQL